MDSTLETNHVLPLRLQILVVDDSRFNQRIAQMILQKTGSVVTLAGDGEEAVNLEKQARFDVIIMDVEMPKLDGFQATAMIRAREKSMATRTPIIAMSAHSTPKYRERCLEAGMDGYIEKPLDAMAIKTELRIVWEKAQANAPKEIKPEIEQVFDRQDFLDRICHDWSLLVQVTGLFQEDATAKLLELRSAMEREDTAAVAKEAHALKGMVSNFSAHPAQKIADRMEKQARRGSLDQGPELVNQLGEQIDHLTVQLLALIDEKAS